MIEIKNAVFVKSASDRSNFLHGDKPQIAVAGKSNVGKSSFINFLANHGKLARTSNTPGRTRLVNYFDFGNFLLVDLPGYGFAKAPKEEQEKWGIFLEDYLLCEPNLKRVVLLVDIRHDPTAEDKMLVDYLYAHTIPFSVIATKEDKLKKSEIKPRLSAIAASLRLGIGNIFSVSSEKKTGKDKVLTLLSEILENQI